MTLRVRPRSHSERSTIHRAVDAFLAAPSADVDARAAEARIFRASAEAWAAALVAHREAAALASLASAEADSADVAFDDAARRWAGSLRDERGRSLVSRLTALTGGLAISDLCRLPYGDQANRMSDLLLKLPGHPELNGDPGHLAALSAATAALQPLAVQDEVATRARHARGRELDLASVQFDAAYVRLYRSFVNLFGQCRTREVLPAFEVRASPKAEGAPAEGVTP
jgi:hypothetical protein